jgi:glycosyltransferase involved in cell wall biosynthesis
MNPKNNLIAIFLATSGHSGVDRIAKNLIPSLLNRGYRVDLLKVRNHGPEVADESSNFRVIDLKSSHVYSSISAVVSYLNSENPAVLFADKDRVNRTALLARFLSKRKPSLILSSGTTISIDLANRGFMERNLQRFSMGHFYQYADNVIVTSQGVATDMSNYTGLDLKHINVVPCPVIHSSLLSQGQQVPDHPWFSEDIPIILGAGELASRKDFDTLIKAFSIIRKKRQLRLVILGKGKQLENLKQLTIQLNISDDVYFAGFQDNPYQYMAHASVFAFSSRWEGLGFVIIEALAVGTQVVATRCPSGPEEILEHGKYGQLVDVGDFEAMADSILHALENPLPKYVLHEAVKKYEIEASTSAYLDAFNLPRFYP